MPESNTSFMRLKVLRAAVRNLLPGPSGQRPLRLAAVEGVGVVVEPRHLAVLLAPEAERQLLQRRAEHPRQFPHRPQAVSAAAADNNGGERDMT
jgi:hypothetical protein